LANVLEKLHCAQGTDIQIDSNVWNFLRKRSNRLENVIHSYSTRNNYPDSSDWPTVPYFQVLRAFNAALVILFYRRVRQVHPGILQGHVDSVINAFLAVHATPSEVEHAGPGTLWPIFLAGCEATTKERREAILKIVELSKERCGLSPVDIAEDIMTAVWNRQDEHLKDNRREPLPTWMDVLKERKVWPLFC
jgi:arginine metabolism regulation protein II